MTTRVVPLPLGEVQLPDFHPRQDEGTCAIVCHVIAHPDGLVVVDTGPDTGHELIDQLFAPKVGSVVDAINRAGFDERDVEAVVNSHLHFDHCGQNHRFDTVPVWITEAELAAAEAPMYTVPEWAHIDDARQRLSADGEQIAPGVRLIHTPGHTPGHQSVLVDTADGPELVVGQACYNCGEFTAGEAATTDMHDGERSERPADGTALPWVAVGQESLAKLRGFEPIRAHFSHDPLVWQP